MLAHLQHSVSLRNNVFEVTSGNEEGGDNAL